MTDPNDVQAVVEGALALLGLVGVPVAAVAAPIISILRGVVGMRNSKKKTKNKGKRYYEAIN